MKWFGVVILQITIKIEFLIADRPIEKKYISLFHIYYRQSTNLSDSISISHIKKFNL